MVRIAGKLFSSAMPAFFRFPISLPVFFCKLGDTGTVFSQKSRHVLVLAEDCTAKRSPTGYVRRVYDGSVFDEKRSAIRLIVPSGKMKGSMHVCVFHIGVCPITQ